MIVAGTPNPPAAGLRPRRRRTPLAGARCRRCRAAHDARAGGCPARPGSGTALVIVNSVCGCAAGQARPGAMLALQNGVIPDRSVTVFAGVDRDAVEHARGYMTGYPPSSPSMGLFKDGKLVSMLQRTDLQQMTEDQVS